MSDRFEVVDFPEKSPASTDNKLTNALAENMESIISIAKDIMEIRKMQVQSEAVLAKMEADKEKLLIEADAYVNKKNADTTQIVSKMEKARELLKDFYNQKNTSGVSAEEFSTVINAIYSLPDKE